MNELRWYTTFLKNNTTQNKTKPKENKRQWQSLSCLNNASLKGLNFRNYWKGKKTGSRKEYYSEKKHSYRGY